MIAAQNFGIYPGALQTRQQLLRRHEVIDTPANIAAAGTRPIRPPRVVIRPLFEFTESIDEAAIEEAVEPRALFNRETGIADVRLGPG